MSTVQTTNSVSAELMAAMNGTSTKTTTTASAAQDRFMTLLVTQMRNQDPLNPLDNAQVTSQLAQLSTVTGIDKLNATLQALQGSYQTSQSMQAASMIGHGVLTAGSSINLAGGKSVFGVELESAADSVAVTIRNSSGTAVRTMDLGAQAAGIVPITWDGKTDGKTTADDGQYSFEVTALRGTSKVTTTGLSFGEVVSVTTGSGGVKINATGLGAVNFSDVKQIL